MTRLWLCVLRTLSHAGSWIGDASTYRPICAGTAPGKVDAAGVSVAVAKSHAGIPGKRPGMGIVRGSVAAAGGHEDDMSSIQESEGIGGLLSIKLAQLALLTFIPSIWRRVMFWVW